MFLVLSRQKVDSHVTWTQAIEKNRTKKFVDISQYKRCYYETTTRYSVNQHSYYTFSCETGLEMSSPSFREVRSFSFQNPQRSLFLKNINE